MSVRAGVGQESRDVHRERRGRVVRHQQDGQRRLSGGQGRSGGGRGRGGGQGRLIVLVLVHPVYMLELSTVAQENLNFF